MADDNNGKLSDVVKKLFNSGLAGVGILNEELLKGVPKEILGQVLQNAKNTKDDFMKAVSNGVTEYLGKINFNKEIERLMDDYEVQMNVNFSFKRKKKGKGKEKDRVVEEMENDEQD